VGRPGAAWNRRGDGGEENGVTESTKHSARERLFFAASRSADARNLNLPSDASYRFNAGVDPGMACAHRSARPELIREIADGTPAKEVERLKSSGESGGRFAEL